jgi:hypothetical protein
MGSEGRQVLCKAIEPYLEAGRLNHNEKQEVKLALSKSRGGPQPSWREGSFAGREVGLL